MNPSSVERDRLATPLLQEPQLAHAIPGVPSPALPTATSPTGQEQATRRLAWLVAGMVATWLACEVAALCGFSESPAYLAGVNLIVLPHFPIALAGMFVFYLCVDPRSREFIALGVVALAIAIAFKLLDFVGGWTTPVSYCACVGLGLGSLVLLAVRAWSSTGSARQQALTVLMTACLVLGSMPLIFFFLQLTIQLHPTTLDSLAYAADGTLGAQIPFVLGRWFRAVPVLAMVPGVVYLTLPLAFMVIVVLHLRANGPPVVEVLPTFLAVAVMGFTVYNFFPLVGPRFAFEGPWPERDPDLVVPRNCMPSLHTAWALVIWWQARPLGRQVRLMAGVYLAFTILATIGYGAHYVFDLVVAFPSTMACQALCMVVPGPGPLAQPVAQLRRRTLLCGLILTLSWLVLLRYGLTVLAFSPLLTAPAALATVAGSLWLEARLYRARQNHMPLDTQAAYEDAGEAAGEQEKSSSRGKIFLDPI
jgi:hypothetical protein